MRVGLPDEPDWEPWDKPHEPEHCDSGLSPDCTDEPVIKVGTKYFCGYCKTFEDRAMADAQAREHVLTQWEDLWARR